MKADPLEDAVSALRERYDGQSDAASRSEDAIIGRMRHKTRQRQRARFAMPFAALLAASSAWAARDSISESVRQVGAWLRHESAQSSGLNQRGGQPRSHEQPRDQGEGAERPKPSRPQPEELAPHSPSSAPEGAPNTLPREPSAPTAKPRSTPSPRNSTAPTARAQNAPSPQLGEHPAKPDAMTLYREAHRLHFLDKNPEQALLAWDRYLARGQGDFAIEARYNRALCLWRLGRIAEAQSELRPFARGDYGGYRQAEAAALLSNSAAPHP
ncbi:MAG TPA: hypothetical protein VFQ61_35760 [Polyangiaceae bacterium]|nr:hypothetical protein [Polyangiaceae bacterium]